jgi:hypothetical protein
MPVLELDDIQSGVLRPGPTPFAASYIVTLSQLSIERVRPTGSCQA